MPADVAARPPAPWLALFEGPRAFAEASMLLGSHWLLTRLPKGDGHPVLTLPGFLATDSSTAVLRMYLRSWGYDAHSWSLGRNLGLRRDVDIEAKLLDRVAAIRHKTGRRVTLLGWSLGGVFAREAARACPDLVRGVITLGSPLGDPKATAIWRLYEAISETEITDPDVAQRVAQLRDPIPGVPVSAIYSDSDSIVSADISCLPVDEGVESIRVFSSHFGMGLNPLVLAVIADRLGQGPWPRWAPYRPSKWARLINGSAMPPAH